MDDHPKWFANRGQFIQTILAGIAVIVGGVNAWPRIKGNQVLSAGAILFYLLIAIMLLSIWLLVRSAASRVVLTSIPPHSMPAVTRSVNVTTPNIVIPTSPENIPTSQVPVSFPGNATLLKFKVSLGNFQELGRVKIELRELRENVSDHPGEGKYGAVLYFDSGGGLAFGGTRVTKISTNCFYLPINPIETLKEPYSIYYHHVSDHYVDSFSAYLEHINPHSGVVTIMACQFNALKPV
jgi:hypothetical protein